MWSGRHDMFQHYNIFWVILFVTCGYALWRGRSDERIVASANFLVDAESRLATGAGMAGMPGMDMGTEKKRP